MRRWILTADIGILQRLDKARREPPNVSDRSVKQDFQQPSLACQVQVDRPLLRRFDIVPFQYFANQEAILNLGGRNSHMMQQF